MSKKFDIIIGNPPFNKGGKRIYPAIINKCIDITNLYLVLIAPIQLIKSYNKEIMYTYNKLVDNGLIHHKEIDENCFGKDVVVPSCYIVLNKLVKSNYKQKKETSENHFPFRRVSKLQLKGLSENLIFKGFISNKPKFEKIIGNDTNPKNNTDKWRIAVTYIIGGKPLWFKKSVILRPGIVCIDTNPAYVVLPCDSKKDAILKFRYLRSKKVQDVLNEKAYSRTLDTSQTKLIPKMD